MKNKLSRRRFLATTTATATAFTAVPRHVLGGQGHVSPNSKTTLACIGCGGQGMINLSNFLAFKEIQVVAVCDVNRESGGYISWDWGQGRETQVCGREPARRAVDKHYGNRSCKA
ncbi:MAG: gfo/Idh/MocA family oxidoreductase, partial [Verrucomicrobiae bacterium]|nr:gfo/Idh/MocA family oxidoreductase [Verrucomicrobiae bacterium]